MIKHQYTLQNPLSFMLLVIFLLFSLIACSTNASPTSVQPQVSTPTAKSLSPTPTTLPAGTVLYQADWSHGLTHWPGSHGWNVVQGQLETDTSGSGTFTLPYKLPVSNYALEVRIQIVRLLDENGGYFSFSAPRLLGKNGYATGISDLKGPQPQPNGAHPSAQVSLDPLVAEQGTGRPIDFEPHFEWHTYRIEVQDNEVSFLSDGVSLVLASSDQTDSLSNGPITFKSDLVILHMSSLRILTL